MIGMWNLQSLISSVTMFWRLFCFNDNRFNQEPVGERGAIGHVYAALDPPPPPRLSELYPQTFDCDVRRLIHSCSGLVVDTGPCWATESR